MKTWQILASRFEDVQAKIAKMNRKALKIGAEPVVLTRLGETCLLYTSPSPRD